MNTFLLNSETANSPVQELLQQALQGGVEVRDAEGQVVAYVLSATEREAWIYAEANAEIDQHRDEIERALGRRGGITTRQLLEKAAAGGCSEQL
jgi:hypothetical protein